jgi:hypothetical protein
VIAAGSSQQARRRRSRRWLAGLALPACLLASHTDQAHARVTVQQTARAAVTVRGMLSAASRSGRLTVDERYGYRRSLRRALKVMRRLDETGETGRRDELGGQVVMLATLAARGALSADRMRPLFRQLDANRVWFSTRDAPRPVARVSVPGDPLVYAYYPGHGLQLQPLFNWTKVNAYWFAKDYDGMQRLIDRLAEVAVPQRGGWVSWEYAWDYPGSRAPWKSGMAQGVALQALARAWEATGHPADLALARRALPGLGVPLAEGGLLGRSSTGRWWPLYAAHPSLRVLNGDLQTIISLYDYAAITADDTALAWAKDGARAAAAVLPLYDSGAWSLYQGSAEASLVYHDLMTLQLRQLAYRSGNLAFRLYADRFAQYRATPPVIAAMVSPIVFAYPSVADSPHATVSVRAHLDKVSDVTLLVSDERGRIVAMRRLHTQHRGTVRASWNGYTGRAPARPGAYEVWLRATDLAGNRSPRTFVGAALVDRDTKAPAVRALRVKRDGRRILLRWRLTDNASGRVTIKISTGHRSVTLHRVTLTGRKSLALSAGPGPFTAAITLTDESGNRTWRARRGS